MRRVFGATAISLVLAAHGANAAGQGAQNASPAATAARAATAQKGPAASHPPAADDLAGQQAIITRYCLGCHNSRTKSGDFVLEDLNLANAGDHADAWERVVRKLRGGLMPPAGRPRPDDAAYVRLRTTIEHELDRAAKVRPDPGRAELTHRLNRLEYANAVRDLLAVEINAADLLPADDSSYGFDNIAGVLKMSGALMERYLSAARVISRLAVGSPPPAVATSVYRVSAETQQHDRLPELPFGTRGGTLIRHVFPQDAEYDIKVGIGGRGGDGAQLEVSIDGVRAQLFTLAGRAQPELRIPVKGGAHDVAVTFLRGALDLVEQTREPFLNPDAPSGTGGQAGPIATVTSVTIAGPHNASGPGDTPSRQRIFVCTPADASQETRCASTIITNLARRAYRGPVTPAQLAVLMNFYEQGRREAGAGGFEAGIELALRRLLASPEFLYRIESDPPPSPGSGPAVARINDFELASRLSFFLWSSIPDEALLEAAAKGTLRTAAGREAQVRRMLADPKASTLAENFGGQWLLIRNLPTSRPGEQFALAFDETLRQSMQRETELLLDSVVRENRGVMELLTADYTFLNERLAEHYGIPNIQGSHFRRVALPADSPRRGLLGHGSILTVTSPAIRTSPVIRGKWILNNVLGAPPPDPPPNVPALPDRRTQAKVKTIRERMAQHRANPACAACHSMIDPTGFALENFDAIGRWRTVDESYNPIDASGRLPDGSSFNGVAELRASLAAHPERFAHTVTEKLMTYALGRGVEAADMPAIREILRRAASDGYPMQSLVLGIVESYPFQYRRGITTPQPVAARAR